MGFMERVVRGAGRGPPAATPADFARAGGLVFPKSIGARRMSWSNVCPQERAEAVSYVIMILGPGICAQLGPAASRPPPLSLPGCPPPFPRSCAASLGALPHGARGPLPPCLRFKQKLCSFQLKMSYAKTTSGVVVSTRKRLEAGNPALICKFRLCTYAQPLNIRGLFKRLGAPRYPC
jgi:hypothetical protein